MLLTVTLIKPSYSVKLSKIFLPYSNLQSEIQTAQQEMENLKKEQKKREEKIKMLKVNIQVLTFL